MEPRLAAAGFRLGNIELIRAVAALMVVLAHLAGGMAARGARLGVSEPYFAFGVSGVDLFFVISGFVIVWSQLSKPRAPWAFMKNRIRRIVPLYWVLTVLAAIVILVSHSLGIPVEGGTLDFGSFASSLLFVSGAAGYQYPVLYQGWTLEYEMLFYLLFASTLFQRRVWITIASAALAIVLIVVFTPVSNRLIEFVLGMTVAVLTNFLPTPPRWLSAGILIVGALAFLSTSRFPGLFPTWLEWGVPSALIIFGAVNIAQLRGRLITELGSASYAVYLVQWFAIPVLLLVMGKFGTPTLWGFVIWGVLIVLTTELVGILFTRFVDKPISRLLRAKGF